MKGGQPVNRDETIVELMENYGDQILHLAYSYVRDKQIAEDLTQEIFIKCYEKLNTFKGNSLIKTWMYRIAINHCKDYLRSWYHRKVWLTDTFHQILGKNESTSESYIIRKFENKVLLEAVFSLPIKYRELIFLFYFHECSLKQISEITKTNINTVKTRLSRGKALIKEYLSERRILYGEEIERDQENRAGW